MRSHLEYYLVCDSQGCRQTGKMEKNNKEDRGTATKNIRNLDNVTYEERIEELGLLFLEKKSLREDLIKQYCCSSGDGPGL